MCTKSEYNLLIETLLANQEAYDTYISALKELKKFGSFKSSKYESGFSESTYTKKIMQWTGETVQATKKHFFIKKGVKTIL